MNSINNNKKIIQRLRYYVKNNVYKNLVYTGINNNKIIFDKSINQ